MKLVDILARELMEWPGDFPGLTQSAVDAEIYSVDDCSDPYEYECLPEFIYASERHSEAEDYPVVTRAQWQAAVEALRSDAPSREALISDGYLPPLKSALPMPNVVPPKQPAIDWSKAPEDCVGCLVELRGEGRIFPSEIEQNNAKTIQFRGKEFAGECLIGEWKFYPRPAESWSGEGLPPVGTVCEFAGGTHCPEDPFDPDLMEGMEVKIIAHFKDGDSDVAAFIFNPRNLSRGNAVVEQGMHGCFRPVRTSEQIAAEEREAEIEDLRTLLSKAPCDDYHAAVAVFEAGYRKQVQP